MLRRSVRGRRAKTLSRMRAVTAPGALRSCAHSGWPHTLPGPQLMRESGCTMRSLQRGRRGPTVVASCWRLRARSERTQSKHARRSPVCEEGLPPGRPVCRCRGALQQGQAQARARLQDPVPRRAPHNALACPSREHRQPAAAILCAGRWELSCERRGRVAVWHLRLPASPPATTNRLVTSPSSSLPSWVDSSTSAAPSGLASSSHRRCATQAESCRRGAAGCELGTPQQRATPVPRSQPTPKELLTFATGISRGGPRTTASPGAAAAAGAGAAATCTCSGGPSGAGGTTMQRARFPSRRPAPTASRHASTDGSSSCCSARSGSRPPACGAGLPQRL